MSIEAVAWALNINMPDALAKFLLVGLANHAGDTDEAWPSNATLARYIQGSSRTVIRKLHALEEAGLIEAGDQELVSHYPANRRPRVWRLARGDSLSPQLRGDTVLSPQPVDNPVDNSGRGDTALSPQNEARGDTPGSSGVTLLSHKPSVEPSLKTSLPRDARGTRLDPEWIPDVELRTKMATERPDLDLKAEHLKFVDYWIAKPGKDGRKLDWPATWRNWMRNAKSPANGRPANGHPKPVQLRILCKTCHKPEVACRRVARQTGDDHEWEPEEVRA